MSDITSNTTSAPSATTSRRRPFRPWIVMCVVLAIVGLVPLVSFQIITSSWFLLARIAPLLEERLGGEVIIGSVEYVGSGVIEIHDVHVRAREIPGDAGEVLRVGRATVELDQFRMWRGVWQIDRAVLDDVRIRLIEDVNQAGHFTFMALQPHMPTVERKRPPSVELPYAVIEFGLFDARRAGGQYEILGTQRVAGTMYPRSGMDYEYDFELREIDDHGDAVAGGIFAKGSWNPSTFAHRARVDGVVFNDRIKRMSPQVVRAWWEEMDLEGRLSEATVQFDGIDSFSISFRVEDAALKLPVGSEEDWVRFHEGQIIERTTRPRMHVERGEIRHERDVLQFDLRGELIGDDDQPALPYRVEARIEDIPPVRWNDRREWMRHVLATVPFHMEFQMSEFRVTAREHGTTPAVDLPHVIADMLQRFQLTDWSIRTRVEVSRGSPTVDEATGELVAAELETEGEVRINDAAGMFERFKYPLEQVEAVLDFRRNAKENVVDIVYLQGQGEGGATMRLSGSLAPPGTDGEIDLVIHAFGMPVDHRLRDALGGVYRNLFDDLLHQPSLDSLKDAGLIPDENSMAELDEALSVLRRERRSVRDAINAINHDDPDVDAVEHSERSALLTQKEELTKQIDRLEQQQAFGAYTLGGKVDLNLNIRREAGVDGDPKLFGHIDLQSLGILDRRFPYPFTITGGRLLWEPDLLTIAETESNPRGLPIRTPGGGHGFITGEVRRGMDDEGASRVMPELDFSIIDERINAGLLAAVPPSSTEREALDDPENWAGVITARTAQLLSDLRLEGDLIAKGKLTTDENHRARHEFVITLDNARAEPTEELAQTIGAAGLLWPDGFGIRNLRGVLRVGRDAVQLLEFTGEHDTGTIRADGRIDLEVQPHRTRLDVAFSDLSLGRYLVNLVPGENVARVHELWDRYQPLGHFDAMLSYRANGDEPEPLELHVKPTRTDVILGGEEVTLFGTEGKLLVRENSVEFHDLRIQMQRDIQDDGAIRLRGSYGMDADDDVLAVQGAWYDGTLESPLILETLRLIDADDQIEQYREFDPTGRFHAHFEYTSPQADRNAEYIMRVQPTELAMTFRGTRVSAALEEDASIVLLPGVVEIRSLAGRVGDNQFHLGGIIRIDDLPSMSLSIDFDGTLMHDKMQAALPDAAREILQTIHFEDGERTRITDASLRLDPYRDAPAGRVVWRTRFDGRIETVGAALNPGIPITELDSSTWLSIEHRPNQPVQLAMDVTGERLRVLNCEVTDLISGSITVDDDGTSIHINDMRGDSYGGALAASGRIDLGSPHEYELRLDLVGLSLNAMIADEQSHDGFVAMNGDLARRADSTQRNPRGEVFGTINLRGVQGQEHTRSGRGSLRAIGGNLDAVPIILQLMHAIQFTIPLVHGGFDHADVSFYIDGERVVFERILVESTFGDVAPLQLIGHGEMDFNTFELDTEFRARSGWQLVRDLAGGLSDQLFAIEITGTLREPEANLVPLPGLVRGLFGDGGQVARE